ncbi:MAG: DUF2612 domain-containing protein [Gammaproteobacteria bacterium]|nr:DUF2612 domain-containing protein [Gammaproteobacteria bacterium]NIR85158.1 DUF2612 domain-containing protein [Gammaproteobacteria bacterium]NIU06207.1 DUF2612 domain-containing protein [Gammaproteobacteria bacterium]NIX87480.1 DUF2612 domain-containing protein [Gammaproteobacteria bacterium]
MTLTKTTDHEDEGLALLIAQFRDKANIEILVRALLAQVQDVEDALWDLRVNRAIDTGEGVQLEVIGRIVGQARAGTSDEEYRVWLKARIKVNRSKGKPEQLIEILDFVVGDVATIRAEEYYPAAFILRIEGGISPLTGSALGQLISEAAALGVRPSVEFYRVGDIFAYSDDGTLVEDQPEGYDRGEYAGISGGLAAPFPGQLDFRNPNNSGWLGVP